MLTEHHTVDINKDGLEVNNLSTELDKEYEQNSTNNCLRVLLAQLMSNSDYEINQMVADLVETTRRSSVEINV